jgi:hypothetical protein
LGLVAILLAISGLPGGDCEGTGGGGTDFAEILLLAVTAIASVACLVAAVRRLLALSRAGQEALGGLGIAALGAGVAVILLAVLSDPDSGGSLFWWVFVLGMLATGVALLALVVAWIARRGADDVGLLVPLYLVGAAVFVYPGLTMLALLVNSGALC